MNAPQLACFFHTYFPSWWTAANLGVPIVLPFLVLLFIGLLYKSWSKTKALLFSSVKDGQLFWVVIALAASAMLDVGHAKILGKPDYLLNTVAFNLFGTFAIGAMIAVTFGTVFTAAETDAEEEYRKAVDVYTNLLEEAVRTSMTAKPVKAAKWPSKPPAASGPPVMHIEAPVRPTTISRLVLILLSIGMTLAVAYGWNLAHTYMESSQSFNNQQVEELSCP